MGPELITFSIFFQFHTLIRALQRKIFFKKSTFLSEPLAYFSQFTATYPWFMTIDSIMVDFFRPYYQGPTYFDHHLLHFSNFSKPTVSNNFSMQEHYSQCSHASECIKSLQARESSSTGSFCLRRIWWTISCGGKLQ